MRNLNLIFVAIVFAIFTLTSCQKEGLQEMESLTEKATTEQIDIESILSQSELEVDNAIEITPEKLDKNTANSRANSILFYDAVHMVPANGLALYSFAKNNLPDPATHKIEVKITPINGNQNLYISGRNAQNNTWRLVRQSTHLGTAVEFTSFRKSGLMNNEDRMYISVTGLAQTSYRVQFYVAEVDCKEFPPAQAVVTYDYVPTYTCDGTYFPNTSSAWAAGYTSWSISNQCGKAEDGYYRNVNLSIPGTNLLIKRLRILDNFRYMQIQTTSCLNPNNADCLWVKKRITQDANGEWKVIFTRNNGSGTKQLKIEMTFCTRNGLIYADMESTERCVSPVGITSSVRQVNEVFEKI